MGRRAALLTVITALAATGCGSAHDVRWQQPPRVQTAAGSPGGRLLYGILVNHSGRTLTLKAGDVRVLDRSGHALPSAAGFAGGYLPAVALQGYGGETFASMDTGAGSSTRLAPGARVPLSIGWTARGGEPAVRIEVGDSSLSLP
jgi:hypothetical protein